MLVDDQAVKYRSLDKWFTTPLGMRVADAFSHEIEYLSEEITGRVLLQLGSCGENNWMSMLKFSSKWIVTPYKSPKSSQCNASFLNIPLEKNSVDCIVAPLLMEAFTKERNPLDEIDRIVKSMGYVIFFGIHPWSFWGVSLRLGHLDCFGQTKNHLISSFWTKYAMLERGYRQCYYDSFFYIPPVKSPTLIKKLEFINEMGKMIWPFPAGFYCLVLQKLQVPEPYRIVERTNPMLEASMTCSR